MKLLSFQLRSSNFLKFPAPSILILSLVTICGQIFTSCSKNESTDKDQPIIETEQPIEGQIAYYPFNLNVRDTSGHQNHGQIHGDLIFVYDRHEKPNRACYFNGVNAYVSVSHKDELNLTNEWTIACWVIPYNLKGPHIILSKSKGAGTDGYILKDHNSTEKIRMELFNFADLSSKTSLVIGNWTFITVTYNRDQMKIYYDGLLDNQINCSTPIVGNADDLMIGTYALMTAYREYFEGIIDDVRIFNRVLNSAEINDLYHR